MSQSSSFQGLDNSSQEPSDQRKRQLSDISESTGESPDAKRILKQLKKISMPPDDATELEWNKTIFRKIEEMYDNYEEIKDCLEFNNEEMAKYKQAVSIMEKEIDDLKGQLAVVKCEKQGLEEHCRLLTESQIKTEITLRERNVVFEGIGETYGEDMSLLYNKIVKILNHMMIFNGQGARVPISKISRLGPRVSGKTRPVVCQFIMQSDIELLMKNRLQLPDRVFVHEDFPSVIEDRRRVLRPIFNRARKMPEFQRKCKLVYDRLYIDNKMFTVAPVNNLHKLPEQLHPRTAAEKQNEHVTVFFTQGSPLSNFHAAPFIRSNIRYSNSEQYIQSKKAELFNDDEIQAKIMQTSNPYEIKALGSKVKNFVKVKWHDHARQVAMEACQAKFSQNHDLLEVLIETGDKIIGEASKDPLWGVGLSLDNPGILDKSTWTGDNLLGVVLMTVRDQLK